MLMTRSSTRSSGRSVLGAVGFVLLLALALSGCVHSDQSIRFNGDGSGSYTLAMGLTSQMVSLSSDKINTQMDDLGQQVKAKGGAYKRYDEQGYSYWAFTCPFDSAEKLNDLLTSSSTICGVTPPSGSPVTGSGGVNLGGTSGGASNATSLAASSDSNLVTNTFHVSGTLDFPDPTANLDLGSIDPNTPGLPTNLGNLSALFADAHLKLAITMPGWITSHDGGTVDGNTVTYVVHPGQKAHVDVVGGGVNTRFVVPAAGGTLLLLALIAGGVTFLLLRRNKRRAQVGSEAAAPATALAPDLGGDYPTLPGGPSGQ